MSFMNWIDERFPATKVWNEHLAQYYAPKNFNFWYFFGSLAMLVLVLQIVTGVWLAMMYKPSAEDAFASVEYIMRDVDYGWLLRYLHSTGASAFFLVVYLHMFRALIYGSHRRPRELLWIIGVIIYVAMMATAFMGYLLPWGQMSYWGAQVIVNLFAAFPFGIGEPLSVWIRGDYVISDATLNRFFALHFLLPFVLAALVFIHIVALHKVGSNNPDGIEIKKNKDENGIPKDGIPFHPYYTVKDIVGIGVFLIFFSAIVFFAPDFYGLFLERAELRAGKPVEDARAHRPGVVLHAVLRDAAAAVYKTVKTRIVKEPAKTVRREIPAVYDTVTVKKLVTPATTAAVNVPPVYESIDTTIKVSDGYLAWAPILCETNVTGDIIRQLQQALNDKNYKAGPVDGVYGVQTTRAVRKYQADNNMPGNGQLTIALVDDLGLKY